MRAPTVFRFAAVLAVTTLISSPALLAQERPAAQEGWISLLEPDEWRGEGTRGLVVQEKRSVRIAGLAYHPTEITSVLINGEPAAMQATEEGQVRFFGYVPVQADLREVEVVVYSGGPPLIRNYPLRPVPAGLTYPEPENAWDEAVGGFRGRRYAVVVGVSQYQDRSIRALKYADKDAQSFYNFLLSDRAGLGGFEEENVTLLLNRDATYRAIRTALFNFLMGATENDIVILYFAGHGAPDPYRPNEHYLLSYDTESENLAGTAFPMEDVSEAVRRLRSRDVIVITDACHSAAVGGQVAMRAGDNNAINRVFLNQLQSSSGGYVTITASEVTQFSQEDSRWGGGHGVFTYYLLDALRGSGDEDGDHIVTLGEMYEYVRERVQRETRNAQVPTVSQTPWDRSWPMAIVLDADAPIEPEQAAPARPRPTEPAQQVEVTPTRPTTPAAAGQPALLTTNERQRTGFFLRTDLGGGSATYETDQASVTGTPVQFTISAGAFIRSNVVVFGTVAADVISGPSLSVDGITVQTDTSVTASQVGFGGGIGLYSRESNVFLGAALITPRLSIEGPSEGMEGSTNMGFGMVLMAGKDWQVRPSLALGGTLRLNIGSMKDQGEGGPTWSTATFGLGFSLTYAPRGVGWDPGQG
jgi:uncharacterized caspase-like protein